MPKILYGISPIGLGHATRSLEILKRLLAEGVDIRVFSGRSVVEFLGGQGVKAFDVVEESSPYVSDGEMKMAALWYLRSWLSLRGTVPRTARLADDFRPDLFVCDEEFSGMSVAGRMKIRRVFIADELELGFARTWLARKVEGRVYRWYRKLQAEVDLLVMPDEGKDVGNLRHVGPVVRRATKSGSEARRSYGLPESGRLVLLSLSGSGLGNFLVGPAISSLENASAPDAFLVITGNRGKPVKRAGVFDIGLVPDNQNLIAAADLVMSTAGKSTIDEAAASGTPLIAIPIKNHAEQERNAAALGYKHEDIGRLPELIIEKLGKRTEPIGFRGADEAAEAILSVLGAEPPTRPNAGRLALSRVPQRFECIYDFIFSKRRRKSEHDAFALG